MIDMIQRTGTKHAGLVPDMGIFQYRPTDLGVAYIRRQHNPEMVDFIIEKAAEGCTNKEIMAMTSEKYPDEEYGEKTSRDAYASDRGLSRQTRLCFSQEV